jgi:hypothetical protein
MVRIQVACTDTTTAGLPEEMPAAKMRSPREQGACPRVSESVDPRVDSCQEVRERDPLTRLNAIGMLCVSDRTTLDLPRHAEVGH